MFDYEKYRDVRREYFGESNKEIRKNYKKYKAARTMKSDCVNIVSTFQTPYISFASLPTTPQPKAAKAVPSPKVNPWKCKIGLGWDDEVQQEGKTPMRYNETNAYASVSAPKSDIAIQREFLLSQLADAWYPKRKELETFFNLYVDNTPKTYKEMIDAIKNDKFTIDPKAKKAIEAEDEDDDLHYGYGPTYGIIWDGPKADHDGYTKATAEAQKQRTAAERIIMTGDGTAGLAALQAFEAWMPAAPTSGSTSAN